jgi:hypothetical protein
MSNYTAKKHRRLPPYGKSVCPIDNHQVSIFFGWPPSKPESDCMVLPDDQPGRYRWPVNGCDVFVSPVNKAIPPTVAQELLDTVIADGAKTIVIFGTNTKMDGTLTGLHFWPGSLIEVPE